MTILKKIKVLSILLIAATIIGAGLDLGFKWIEYSKDFMDGFRHGYQIEKAIFEGEADGEPMTFIEAFATFVLVLTLVVTVFRLVINYIGVLSKVKKAEVFSKDLEWRTNHIGIGLIVLYAAEWGLTLLTETETVDCPSFAVLCSGIGLMIVAQIFALGRNMKEDQEFMV